MNQVALVLLAAGSSKRMGQPKQLLPWNDSTLLGHAIKNILSTGAFKLFLVLGAHSDQITAKVDLSGMTVLINENWQQGLGSSIAFATGEINEKHADIKAVLFLLADQPFIESTHLDNIIQLHFREQESIVLTRNKEYRGVPVLFPRKFFPELLVLSNDEGAKKVIASHKEHVMEVVTRNETADIDTFDTYVKLRQLNKER
ncbi:NTP transferase domain-containing protein [Flavobacterium sp. ENC]|uniref:nucleotidyltransferase family protein n=1 Tax=Flavobacterium sp. ENC TaxID=2897330 RepID=UPI001E4B3149|nr:nucleotidyltransferase family protein [Flavobacterium sp. ENC]MCD0465190.1 nucleotidyltransferase family protein [Flavobacterium sp. ENC]